MTSQITNPKLKGHIMAATLTQLKQFDFSWLGNEENARIAVELKNGYDKLPDGWKELHGGTSRRAYLAPDGLVYKVQRQYEAANQEEVERFDMLRRHDEYAKYAPKARLINVPSKNGTAEPPVIVVEFIPDNGYVDRFGPAWAEFTEAMYHTNIGDLHVGNVRNKNGHHVIIDAGGFSDVVEIRTHDGCEKCNPYHSNNQNVPTANN